MMIRDYKNMMGLKHTHTEQMRLKCAKAKRWYWEICLSKKYDEIIFDEIILNLIENQPDIDKIYLYAKDPYEAKYKYLINKRQNVGINHFNDPKAFIEY